MATTVVNSTPATTQDNGMAFLLGVILFIMFIVVLLFLGIPYIQRTFNSTKAQINIPDHVNVNIQKDKSKSY